MTIKREAMMKSNAFQNERKHLLYVQKIKLLFKTFLCFILLLKMIFHINCIVIVGVPS